MSEQIFIRSIYHFARRIIVCLIIKYSFTNKLFDPFYICSFVRIIRVQIVQIEQSLFVVTVKGSRDYRHSLRPCLPYILLFCLRLLRPVRIEEGQVALGDHRPS